MSLAIKPHTVTRLEADEQAPGGEYSHTQHEEAGTHRVQITPMKAGSTFERYGVELSKPHQMLTDPNSGFRKGDRLLYGARLFSVETDPMVWDAEPATAHEEFLLEERAAT